MNRKKVVLFGRHKNNDLLLQMVTETSLHDDLFTYQIVKVPGKGYRARKLDPQLKTSTLEEAIQHADKIIIFDELPSEIESLIKDKEIVYFQDSLNALVKDCETSLAVHLKYGEEYFQDVLEKLAEFLQNGYRFQLKTRDRTLKKLLSVFREEKESDICIWLNPKKECEFEEEIFEDVIRECARSVVSDDEYQKRMIGAYRSEWKRIIYESANDLDIELFFSCSRKPVTLYGEQIKIYEALKNGRKAELQCVDRRELEKFTAMCTYEALKANYIEMLQE